MEIYFYVDASNNAQSDNENKNKSIVNFMGTFEINFRGKSCISAKYRAKSFWFNFCVQEMNTYMKIDVMSIFFRWDNIKFNIITLTYKHTLQL